MLNPIPKVRREVLVALESIVGSECYNASMQNYGPGGVREADGRAFRYPIVLRSMDGTKTKIRESHIPASATDEMVRSGNYQFGANQLDIMEALEHILRYLESQHGLVLRVRELSVNTDNRPENQ